MVSDRDRTASIYIVHSDRQFLVLYKPSGLSTTAPAGGRCLVQAAKKLDLSSSPLHPISRLDCEVSGLVTFTRTRGAIRALLEARKTGIYTRLYLAISSGVPQPEQGCWRVPITIDPRNPRRRIASNNQKRSRFPQLSAVTHYRTILQREDKAILHLRPQTGRTHQLRVHTSAAGVPLMGDIHYGGPKRLVCSDGRVIRIGRVMLHCAQLILPNLIEGGLLRLEVQPPLDMKKLWVQLGGDAEDLHIPALES